MMDIQVSKFENMTYTGTALLRAIQNDEIPHIDLLVREAVQNSLDAANKEDTKKKSVIVNIGSERFNIAEAAANFEGISDELKKRYSGTEAELLYVEDANTKGLTGPIDSKNVPIAERGNIFKLIYGIDMPQTEEGSGGSWGLGKTVYYRLGLGLVIYYSRIEKEDGSYEHRLAACLIEDETSSDKLYKHANEGLYTGICWWGKAKGNRTIPITDYLQIQTIMKSLNMSLYKGNETGTKVIIPFINTEQLLEQVKHKDIEPNHFKDTKYVESIDAYTKLAFQKWYAPRLDNQVYQYGKWLDARVGKKRMLKGDMHPLFQEIQKLYNSAAELPTTMLKDFYKSEGAYISPVELIGDFTQKHIGNVAFKKFTKEDLNLHYGGDVTPYELMDVANEAVKGNSPIVLFTRQPGMIINYETTGKWCSGINDTEDGEYIIGFFVPFSNVALKKPFGKVNNLESYLRATEKADHTNWNDIVSVKKFTIVKRIQEKTRTAINDKYNARQMEVNLDDGKLSRRYGRVLLPTGGFGTQVTEGNNSGKVATTRKVPSTTSRNNSNFKIISQSYDTAKKLIHVVCEMDLKEKSTAAVLSLFIQAGSDKFSGNEWEDSVKGFNQQFPMSIENITIDTDEQLNAKSKEVERLTAEFIQTSKHQRGIGLRIEKPLIAIKVFCSFDIKLDDVRLTYGMELTTEEGDS